MKKIFMLSFILYFNILLASDESTYFINQSQQTFTTTMFKNQYRNEPFKFAGEFTEDEFYQIIITALDFYKPLASLKNKDLHLRYPIDMIYPSNIDENDLTDEMTPIKEVIANLWKSEIDNAHATNDSANDKWYITIYGGLARQPEINAEAFTLILCHEIGHFWGGFPLYLISPFTGVYAIPLASEGQSDYYGAQVCVKNLWKDLDNTRAKNGMEYKLAIELRSKNLCEKIYESQTDRNLCYKTVYAAEHAAALWQRKSELEGKNPSILTPDPLVVDETNQFFYPNPQCRFDTYISGTLCPTKIKLDEKFNNWIEYDLALIPGIDSPEDPDSINARNESKLITCQEETIKFGARPRCWFNPDYYSNSVFYNFDE